MSDKPIHKQAVDSEAEQYWSSYFEDTGYGKLWVRKIQKRVQAALKDLEKQAGKTASTSTKTILPTIRPLASVITDSGVHLEGVAVYGTGELKKVKAFVADFDHEGNVNGFDTVDVSA